MTRRYYLAAAALLALFVIACSIERAEARPLPATNAGTSVTSACVDGRWVVTMAVSSEFDGVIHVQLDDPHGPSPLITLAAHATHTVTEHPDAGSTSWTWQWSSPDGHLTGNAVSGTVTRPVGCGVAPTTTVGVTTTTTCTQAIPPRDDCTTEAPPSTTTPTTAPTAPPTSVPPSSLGTSPIATTAPGSSTSPTAAKPSKPPSSTPINHTNLPVTGSNATLGAVVGLGFALAGIALVVAVRRRAS